MFLKGNLEICICFTWSPRVEGYNFPCHFSKAAFLLKPPAISLNSLEKFPFPIQTWEPHGHLNLRSWNLFLDETVSYSGPQTKHFQDPIKSCLLIIACLYFAFQTLSTKAAITDWAFLTGVWQSVNEYLKEQSQSPKTLKAFGTQRAIISGQ